MSNQIESLEQKINQYLSEFNVVVFWGEEAVLKDFPHYDKGMQKKIIQAIIKKCQGNPLLIPDGSGIPLHGELAGFAKLRMKREGIRIVYRPVQNEDHIRVEICTIGPRENEKVYNLAMARLPRFLKEIQGRE